MNATNRHTRLSAIFATLVIIVLFSGQALATDDGARAYWKGWDGINGFSFQYLRLDLDASDSKQFAPGQYVYPHADVEGSIFITNYVRHLTLFNRPSSFLFTVTGGSIDADIKAGVPPSPLLPPGYTGAALSQSSTGFADPSAQLVVNLFGAPPLKKNYDLIDYEPTLTFDAAVMLAFPVGEYDNDKLVNLGLNRWFGRVAFPITYYFGVFTPGYRNSFEVIPSVWLFGENDDFMGQKLENDPMWQLEAHLTHDFTPTLWGSLDVLYRNGFQSEIGGVEVGEEFEIGDLGLTLNYEVNDNLSIKTGFSSNVFGNDDLDTSMVRIQFVFGWHRDNENIKKLQRGH
jgi:hypothetical protein